MKEKGIEFVFVVPQDIYKKSEITKFSYVAKNLGFKVYKINVVRPSFIKSPLQLRRFLLFLFTFVKSVIEIYKLLRIESPDVVQINGLICINEALTSIIFMRKKVVWNLIGNIYPRILLFFLIPLIRAPKIRVFVARSLIRYYFGKKDDIVIPEPVDIQLFDINKIRLSTAKVKEMLGINESDIVIGYLGFITPIKGLEYLIESFCKVKRRFNNVKLLIIGSAPPQYYWYKAFILEMIKRYGLQKDVIFVGYKQGAELVEFLSLVDIVVLPSLNEGTPVSLLEAMALAKPVIATRVGGVPEIVKNGYNGILVNPKNVEELAKAIEKLVIDKRLRHTMGYNALNYVKIRHHPDRIAEKYYELYKVVTQQ